MMPYRRLPLVTGEIYHVFNRSVAKQPIFLDFRDYKRALETIKYYRFPNLPLRFSHFTRLNKKQKEEILNKLNNKGLFSVEILAFCLMPNHFHFLLKPLSVNGLSKFLANFQNSYSKYFNTKYERSGALFQSMFKAVRIESDEQLLHVSRYIHLNPVTSLIIKIDSLPGYQWSSFKEYLSFEKNENTYINTKLVLDMFDSKNAYKDFVFNQENYQKELDKIKHLSLE